MREMLIQLDVDNSDRRWQERAVETHGWHQVEVEFLLPLVVIEHSESPGWRRRATDNVHDDVNATKVPPDSIDYSRATCRRGDVSSNEHSICRLRTRPGRAQDLGTHLRQPRDDCLAQTLGAAGHEGTLPYKAIEMAVEHHRISRDTIFPPLISKMWSSMIGLPGKLPDTLPVTTTFPS